VNVARVLNEYPYGAHEKLNPGVETVTVVVKFTGADADADAARASVTSAAISSRVILFIVVAPFEPRWALVATAPDCTEPLLEVAD
jgi:hypothetical protein